MRFLECWTLQNVQRSKQKRKRSKTVNETEYYNYNCFIEKVCVLRIKYNEYMTEIM